MYKVHCAPVRIMKYVLQKAVDINKLEVKSVCDVANGMQQQTKAVNSIYFYMTEEHF